MYTSSKHHDTLFKAIQNGDFYASNGIVLDSISTSLSKIFVRSTNGSKTTFIGSGGRTLAVVNAGVASYSVKGDEGYFRAQISNTLNQTAWIQPLMLVRTTEVGRRESIEKKEPASHSQRFLNPYNPNATIRYNLPESAHVRISIHNILSQAVATLVGGEKTAGHHQAQWRASNEPSGVHFYKIETGSFVETKKMILLC